MSRIMFIGAHPDDSVILSGGLMLKHAKNNDDLFVAYLTDGRYGSKEEDPQDTAALRKSEAKATCEYLGAKMFWGGFEDSFLFDNKESRIKACDFIRDIKPDLIVTHSADDYHPDHIACHNIVKAANILACTSAFCSNKEPTSHITPIWQMDTLGKLNPRANVFIDIENEMSQKMEALSKHASQIEWLTQTGLDIPSLIWKQAAMRGEEAGCVLAEAFEVLSGWGLNRTTSLLR